MQSTKSLNEAQQTPEPIAGATSQVHQANVPTLDATDAPAPRANRTGHEPPAQFGDYELIEEIARGGMGVVYRARQTKLNRIVALKTILAGPNATKSDIDRFYAEAAAAARLDHPGIVPIFEIGQQDGQNFFSMAYVEGQSLAARLVQGPLEPHDAASLMKRVAEAIDYAHRQGIVHRDLKPANVLLDGHGEPRVTDFGLAKCLVGESNLTASGAIMGTPSFMPPEQASGGTAEAGPLADVYSLGAMLYCLLTGRPPFQAATPVETLRQVLVRDPVPPRRLNAQITRDLETICLKCLEKTPKRRYASAAELAQDLNRHLRNEPIRARPPSWLGRAWRLCLRNKLAATLLAALALSLFYPVVVGLITIGSFAIANRSQIPDWKQEGMGATFGFVKDGVVEANGILVDTEPAAREALSRVKIDATLFQFRSGRVDDKHFHSGGVIRVWLEVEDQDGLRNMADRLFDLRCEKGSRTSKVARFGLLRSDGEQRHTEKWTIMDEEDSEELKQEQSVDLQTPVSSFQGKTRDTRNQGRGTSFHHTVKMPQPPSAPELLASLPGRVDLPDDEKDLLAKEIQAEIDDTTKFSLIGGSTISRESEHNGTLVSNERTKLFEKQLTTYGIEALRRKLKLPDRDEKPEMIIRIFCQLLTDEEIQTAEAGGQLQAPTFLNLDLSDK